MDCEHIILLAIKKDLFKDGFNTKLLKSGIIASIYSAHNDIDEQKPILIYEEYCIILNSENICIYNIGKLLKLFNLNDPKAIENTINSLKLIIRTRSVRVQKTDQDQK